MARHAPAADSRNPAFPFDLRWSAQDIADAVPLRLCEIVRFDLVDATPANRPSSRRAWREGYVPRNPSRPFRIQG